ncbi:hypothetical protein MOQ_002875 [Trypanosoma cruzi marinkellei]|uniref:Uncharacterized protein n=1 Tax=Trypanosoma cruzi marinkellei TaxID=85056 RepID=K2NE84_TRYCR|nr:hypothetical protein MOQ_002875 [Trypanosoma cruzi marinkellei]
MENEKLIWAGVGLFTMASFIYLQGPLLSSRGRSSTRQTRGERTNSRQRQHTLTSIAPSERVDRSRGSAVSKKELSNGRFDGKNGDTVFTSIFDPQSMSPPPRKVSASGSPLETDPSYQSRNSNKIFPSQHTARHRAMNTQSASVVPAQAERRRVGTGRSTQTDNSTWEELCRLEALVAARGGDDPLGFISPIACKEKDIGSPISPAALYFSPSEREKKKNGPLLPPSLERGVEMELTKRVGAVHSPSAGAKEWLDLYNFVIDIPRSVLQHIWRKKSLGLFLPPLSSPTAAMLDKPAEEVDPLWRIQEHILRLVSCEPCQVPKNGRFRLSEDGANVVWCSKEGKKSEKMGRFSHVCVFSSDEDEPGKDDDTDTNVAERVEKVLLACRQARMHSFSTQFPEESTEAINKPVNQPQVAMRFPFEERDVMALLGNLVKLRNHASFDALRRSGNDVSFVVAVIDLMNDAQRLLDRAAIWMTSVEETSKPNVKTPPESRLMPSNHRILGKESKLSQEELVLNSPDARCAGRDAQVVLRGSATHGTGKFLKNQQNAPSFPHFGHENSAATPPRNGDPDAFARFLSASTIPSAVLEENERRRTSFARSRTQIVIENASSIPSENNSSNGAQLRNNVFDRLYTPPKNALKPNSQVTPPISGRAKAPFNVYV